MRSLPSATATPLLDRRENWKLGKIKYVAQAFVVDPADLKGQADFESLCSCTAPIKSPAKSLCQACHHISLYLRRWYCFIQTLCCRPTLHPAFWFCLPQWQHIKGASGSIGIPCKASKFLWKHNIVDTRFRQRRHWRRSGGHQPAQQQHSQKLRPHAWQSLLRPPCRSMTNCALGKID